jgi:hypothetical protein
MAAPKLNTADVWASDMIELAFDQPMANNDDLINPLNYTVTSDDSGDISTVLSVRTGNEPFANNLFLILSHFIVGEKYTVIVNESLISIDKVFINDIFRTTKFIGRRTKIDSVISAKPDMFNMSPDSIYRNITNAIHRADDLIGGSRNDILPLLATTNIGVTITPKFVNLAALATQQFTAVLTGTGGSASLTWEVNGIVGGNGTVGTITVGGLYTAPAAIPAPNLVNIGARRVADPSKVDFSYSVRI